MSLPYEESTQPFSETRGLECYANTDQAIVGEARSAARSRSPSSSSAKTQWEPRAAAAALALAATTDTPKSTTRESTLSNNLRVEELVEVFTKASLSSLPDARLILRYPHYPDGKGTSKDSAVIRLPRSVGGCDMIGVVQRTQDVDFIIRLPFYDPPCEKPSPRLISYELRCQILYNPVDDGCLFVNWSVTEVHLTDLGSPSSRNCIAYSESQAIWPGIWRISAGGGGGNSVEQHLIDFLVLRRHFSVIIHSAPTGVSTSTKRPPSDSGDGGNGRRVASKRQKLEDAVTQILIAPSANLLEAALEPVADVNHGPVSTPSRDIGCNMKAATPLLDLLDGEVAVVRTADVNSPQTSSAILREESAANGPVTYNLRRIEQLGATSSTSVFTCQHSAISGHVVAKVLRYKGKSADGLARVADFWKREKMILEKLHHRNIMSLKAFDGRLFAIYVELLPPSLFRGTTSPFEPPDVYKILRDTSSALAYLEDQQIVHNDIKPRNIAYSPERGAVLLDFGMATSGKKGRAPGGSPWYLPPDLVTSQTRGFPGDMWAFGITMLYVLGKIKFPERKSQSWAIDQVSDPNSVSHKRMMDWLQLVANNREELDQRIVVEYLVYRMLDVKGPFRIKAANIVSTLDDNKKVDAPRSRSL